MFHNAPEHVSGEAFAAPVIKMIAATIARCRANILQAPVAPLLTFLNAVRKYQLVEQELEYSA